VQTQIIINCAALPSLLRLLTEPHKKSIKKEACWTLSNIAAGTSSQIQALFDAGLVPPLLALAALDARPARPPRRRGRPAETIPQPAANRHGATHPRQPRPGRPGPRAARWPLRDVTASA